MSILLVSLTEPAPPGFRYDPQPGLRRCAFGLYSADPVAGEAVVRPIGALGCGILVTPSDDFQATSLGPYCSRFDVPPAMIPWLASWLAPQLHLMQRMRRAEDAEQAQGLEAARAISDRAQVLREHSDYRNTLLKEVGERRRMEQALRDADRRKDEFLALLSHELRNPLAAIRNSLFVLSSGRCDAVQAERNRAIAGRQIEHLTRIVDDLLDLTRIAQNKIQLRRERLDLRDIVRHCVEDHAAAFRDAGLALGVTLGEQPSRVMADQTRMTQIVGNLLQNSLKFTQRGGSVSVTLENAGDGALLRVRDTGVGMTREVIDKLFQPFSQADRTLDRSRGGLGLGLALVRQLVELHGGKVWAESGGPSQGARFSLSLPLDSAQPSTAAGQSQGEAASSRRILLIEDNHDAAESLRDALVLLGHKVEVAFDGPTGLEMTRNLCPEVVVCDIGLPGMDGYELARLVREDPSLKGVKLIALTGYAQREDLKRARAAGFDEHLAKPPSLLALGDLIAKN